MTTKTYFMRSFNFILSILLSASILYLFGYLFKFIPVQLSTVTIINMETIEIITDTIASFGYGFTLVSLLLALLLTGIEIINRLKKIAFGTISSLSIILFCCDTSCSNVNECKRKATLNGRPLPLSIQSIMDSTKLFVNVSSIYEKIPSLFF